MCSTVAGNSKSSANNYQRGIMLSNDDDVLGLRNADIPSARGVRFPRITNLAMHEACCRGNWIVELMSSYFFHEFRQGQQADVSDEFWEKKNWLGLWVDQLAACHEPENGMFVHCAGKTLEALVQIYALSPHWAEAAKGIRARLSDQVKQMQELVRELALLILEIVEPSHGQIMRAPVGRVAPQLRSQFLKLLPAPENLAPA
jgi:hypothetical protein